MPTGARSPGAATAATTVESHPAIGRARTSSVHRLRRADPHAPFGERRHQRRRPPFEHRGQATLPRTDPAGTRQHEPVLRRRGRGRSSRCCIHRLRRRGRPSPVAARTPLTVSLPSSRRPPRSSATRKGCRAPWQPDPEAIVRRCAHCIVHHRGDRIGGHRCTRTYVALARCRVARSVHGGPARAVRVVSTHSTGALGQAVASDRSASRVPSSAQCRSSKTIIMGSARRRPLWRGPDRGRPNS